MPPSAAPNLAEIARIAGVSTATVSMSLRGRPGIAVATRERIVALAQQLGYRPNPYVSALMRTRRTGRRATAKPLLALVSGLARPDAWRKAESVTRRQIREGAIVRAAQLGYEAREFWLHQDGMSPERFSRMLHARGIHGLVLGPLPDGAPPPALAWELFSVVAVSVPFRHVPLHVVCNDHYFSSFTAVQECLQLGYRRPGLLMRRSHREHFQGRWEAGFFAALQTHADVARVPPLLLDSVEFPEEFDGAALRRWLRAEKPDVIVTSAAAVVEQALAKIGRQVPKNIGVAGLSCPEVGHHLSGVCQNGRLIGATAIDQLTLRLERNERGLPRQAVTVMIEGMWNAGETLRSPSPRQSGTKRVA
jgi:DNA-binding LacI/PurR family transcriptional regulator